MSFERFTELTGPTTVESWRDHIYALSTDLGYESLTLAIFPDRPSRVEARFAFIHSNYSPQWRSKYDEEKMGYIDPLVAHCLTRSTPLIWSPDIFSNRLQQEMYEEACSYGIRSGVSLPVHGPNGEHGVISFVSDTKPDGHRQKETTRKIPELTCFRDFIFETSLQFMKPAVQPDEKVVALTQRELECLKWSASGKSSWDIAYILNCTEAGVNSHFSKIRQKFGTSTRRQAVVKAIRMGIIPPT